MKLLEYTIPMIRNVIKNEKKNANRPPEIETLKMALNQATELKNKIQYYFDYIAKLEKIIAENEVKIENLLGFLENAKQNGMDWQAYYDFVKDYPEDVIEDFLNATNKRTK
ncbi:MAG: hypothetical protein WCQ95_01340 [Bacteroidota bacterium]